MMTLEDAQEPFHCLSYDMHGDQIATGTLDLTVRLWNAHDGYCTTVLNTNHKGRINCIIYASDNTSVLTGCEGGNLNVWSISDESGTLKAALAENLPDIKCIKESPNDRAFVFTSGSQIFTFMKSAEGDIPNARSSRRSSIV